MAALIKKIRRIPLVYSLQDIFPDSLVGTGMAKKGGALWKVGRMIEDFTYRNADRIIVISEDFKRNIMAKGVPESKIEVIYNWVDETAIIPIPRNENPLFAEFGLDQNKFYVVYAGNLGSAQNIDILLEAANLLHDNSDIQFLVFGAEKQAEPYITKAKHMQLSNLKFLPLQPYVCIVWVMSQLYHANKDLETLQCLVKHGALCLQELLYWLVLIEGLICNILSKRIVLEYLQKLKIFRNLSRQYIFYILIRRSAFKWENEVVVIF